MKPPDPVHQCQPTVRRVILLLGASLTTWRYATVFTKPAYLSIIYHLVIAKTSGHPRKIFTMSYLGFPGWPLKGTKQLKHEIRTTFNEYPLMLSPRSVTHLKNYILQGRGLRCRPMDSGDGWCRRYIGHIEDEVPDLPVEYVRRSKAKAIWSILIPIDNTETACKVRHRP